MRFFCTFVNFPYGVLGQVGYLIVSILDICLLPYFLTLFAKIKFSPKVPNLQCRLPMVTLDQILSNVVFTHVRKKQLCQSMCNATIKYHIYVPIQGTTRNRHMTQTPTRHNLSEATSSLFLRKVFTDTLLCDLVQMQCL